MLCAAFFRGESASVTTAWRIFTCRLRGRPRGMMCSCECIKKAVAGSRKGVVIQYQE